MLHRFCIALLGLAICLSGQSLKKLATIELPGPKGQRCDYLTMDDEDRYLLSAHLGPGILYVIDVRTNKLVKAIPGVPGITGLEYVSGLRKVYTSDWGEEKIGVVDLHSMSVIKRLPTAAKPNGSTYAAPFRKVYVSDTLGKAVAVVDVDKDQIVKTLKFNSETGMPQYDSVARRVYVNLRSTNQVAEIDPSTDTVIGQDGYLPDSGNCSFRAFWKADAIAGGPISWLACLWRISAFAIVRGTTLQTVATNFNRSQVNTNLGQYPVEGCRYNHGMAVDSDHHRGFLLCGGTRTLTVFALDTHRTITHLPLPQGADVVKFDPGLRRIYAACSSGAIAVYHKMIPTIFEKLGTSGSSDWFTVLRSIRILIVFTLPNRKKMANRWRGS